MGEFALARRHHLQLEDGQVSGRGPPFSFGESAGDYLLVGQGRWLELSLWSAHDADTNSSGHGTGSSTGGWNTEGCTWLPTVCAILQDDPGVTGTVGGKHITGGAVAIKRLEPGARLVPHVGPSNERTPAL